MSTKQQSKSDYWAYLEELQSTVRIDTLYEQITGEKFTNHQGRLRARVSWREDNSPSLTLYEARNILTDFGVTNPRTGKAMCYNHFDILVKTGKATDFLDAAKQLAESTGRRLPDEIFGAVKEGAKYRDALREAWEACTKQTERMFADPRGFEQIRSFAELRKIPLDFDFWKGMDIGIWMDVQDQNAIVDKYKLKDEEGKKKKKETLALRTIPSSYGRAALVFPLYNKSGQLTGLTIRYVVHKEFRKCQLDDSGMYGVNALSPDDEQVGITEGQMNRVAIAADLFNVYGRDFLKYMPPVISLGSKTTSAIRSYEGYWKEVIYLPDNDLPGSRDKKDCAAMVVEINSILKAPNFSTVFWGDKKDGYDVESYLREGNSVESLRDKKISIADFLKEWIELHHVRTTTGEQQRNAARIVYSENYAEKLYNPADRKALKDHYIHVTDYDVEFKEKLVDEADVTIRQDLGMADRRYYKIENGDNGPIHRIIAPYIVRAKYKILRKKGLGTPSEGARCSCRIVADICFDDGRKMEAIFNDEDIADPSSVMAVLSSVEMSTRLVVADSDKADLYACIQSGLMTSVEVLEVDRPGPHLWSESPDFRMTTPKPRHFGETLLTYINGNCSVINGSVFENSSIGVSFIQAGPGAKPYSFGRYSDEEHFITANMVWRDVRALHHESVMDFLLGFAACAPIKHVLLPNVSGLVVALIGQTHAKKTSRALIVQNLFGDFSNDSVLTTFHGTPNAFETEVAMGGTAMIAADEFKASPKFPVESLGDIIHSMYSGTTKKRLGEGGQVRESSRFTGNYIFTAERMGEFQSSTEARHLQLRIEAYEAREVYDKLMKPENLSKLKCFMPRLICWQHRHIDELKAFYAERANELEVYLEKAQNSSRLASQLAMVETGLYSMMRFLCESGACTEEQWKKAFASFQVWNLKNSQLQLGRAKDMANHQKFLSHVRDLIITSTVNVCIVEGEGSAAKARFTQDDRKPVQIVKFTKRGQTHYAILSLERFLLELNAKFGKEGYYQPSIRNDLAEHGIINLDARGHLLPARIPKVEDPQTTRQVRALVLSEKSIFSENEEVFDDSVS